ncbi:unnamed protein product [Dovyalis caffra]|uniref:Uncharacterized protein n=1 Tax=Dovyalis caffra TaxID=77055 RepID=A0AAV1SRR9_9ROSI|nr:unnamed protein product [Dovyalis caffra]
MALVAYKLDQDVESDDLEEELKDIIEKTCHLRKNTNMFNKIHDMIKVKRKHSNVS